MTTPTRRAGSIQKTITEETNAPTGKEIKPKDPNLEKPKLSDRPGYIKAGPKPNNQPPVMGSGHSAKRFAKTAPKLASKTETAKPVENKLEDQVGKSITVPVKYNGGYETMDAKIVAASWLDTSANKSWVTVEIKVGSKTLRCDIILDFREGQFKSTSKIDRFISQHNTEPINLDAYLY